jgi:hypothetical protein
MALQGVLGTPYEMAMQGVVICVPVTPPPEPQVVRPSTRAVGGGGGAPWVAVSTQTRQSDRWVEATDFDRATVDAVDWTADDEEVMMIITTFLKVVSP